jgi:hypothetical protein
MLLRNWHRISNDSTVIPAIIENEADPSRWERAEQLRGLGIFVANFREEYIDKILKSRLELEELAGNPDGGRATAP